jgi:8-oxo-dGTP diphosphatase
VGADDALQAKVFTQDNLPPLVFDHEKILDDYFKDRYQGGK